MIYTSQTSRMSVPRGTLAQREPSPALTGAKATTARPVLVLGFLLFEGDFHLILITKIMISVGLNSAITLVLDLDQSLNT